jgi:hypothetical protein
MPPSPKSGTSEVGQSLPKRDVRVRSVYPSISDVILPRRERREWDGPAALPPPMALRVRGGLPG